MDWAIESSRAGLWQKKIVRQLYGFQSAEQVTLTTPQASFFIKYLIQLIPFYKISTELEGGVKRWKWTTSGLFSCASAYKTMHHSGLISATQSTLWKIRIPMKVKIFIWLMLDNKILTQQNLHSRRCPIQVGCHLCSNQSMETRDHLMWDCKYASALWQGLRAHYNIILRGNSDIGEAWIQTGKPLSQRHRARWNVIWAAGARALWRERNRRLFSDKRKDVSRLITDTTLEIERWLR